MRIYLDTSVISHLYAMDAPEQMLFTWRLWTLCVAGEYEVFVSDAVFDELTKAPEPKRSLIFQEMGSLKMEILTETDDVSSLAAEYVKHGILREKDSYDCLHMAYTAVYNCDVLVSWNYKHLVKPKTIDGVKTVNAMNHYREIAIVSPDTILSWRNEK